MNRRSIMLAAAIAAAALPVHGQDSLLLPEPETVLLEDLVHEALARNPSILASLEGLRGAEERRRQAGTLEAPILTYTRMEMAGFRWSHPMAEHWELMQPVRFPTKYGSESEAAAIGAEHVHHEAEEVVNAVLLRVRESFARLWHAQQLQVLEAEAGRLTVRLREVAAARYRVGASALADVLHAELLAAQSENTAVMLRRKELGIKADMLSLVDRPPDDTIGYALVVEQPSFDWSADSLISLARRTRPMLIHDSLRITEQRIGLRLARQAYLPDFHLGISYLDSRHPGFGGWGLMAGVSLPFVPWNLGPIGAGVREGESRVRQAEERFAATEAEIAAGVRGSVVAIDGLLRNIGRLSSRMIPAVEQGLESALSLYRQGEADYASVHRAYEAFLGTQREYFDTRLEFELEIARLRRATGYNGAF